MLGHTGAHTCLPFPMPFSCTLTFRMPSPCAFCEGTDLEVAASCFVVELQGSQCVATSMDLLHARHTESSAGKDIAVHMPLHTQSYPLLPYLPS